MPIEPPLSKLTPEQIFQAFLNNGMDEMHFYNTVKYAGRPATGSQWLAMYDCEFCPDDGVMGRRVPREQAESIETARVFVTVDAHGLLIADN